MADAKTRHRIQVTFEFDVHPEAYPDDATPEQRLAIDVENYRSMPDAVCEQIASSEYEVTGEVL